jgi:hypothetical protein
MIAVPTAPWAHTVFDLLAWAAGAAVAIVQHRRRPKSASELARRTRPSYFVALALGALTGAWLAGSLNSLRWAHPALSHSVAGALAGGIVAVELWKKAAGVRGSTGGGFVAPLVAGIVVGRLGCLFAGLPDGTFGIATSLPWAVDLGYGVGRHPVQLYESVAMALFGVTYWRALMKERSWAVAHGFQAFAIAYGAQRFLWEFLKPYPPVIGPLNIFHLIAGGLIVYGCAYWNQAGAGADDGALSVPQRDDEPVRNLPEARSGQGGDRG